MDGKEDRPLTEADRTEIFKLATHGFSKQFAEAIKHGMTDQELQAALSRTLGIFGGSSGPDRFSTTFTGSGLRIWGGWHIVNHVKEKPLFAGRRTIAKAREVYGISNPDNKQLNQF